MTKNIHLHFILLIGLLCGCMTTKAQNNNGGKSDAIKNEYKSIIESIQFKGLKRTKESYLTLLLTLKVDSIYNDSLLLIDEQRLRNLRSIRTIIHQIDTLENTINSINQKISITYVVEEKRTLLPMINFGRIEGNLFFQLGFLDNNWGGKGNQILTYYQYNDNRHSGNIYYKIPYLKNRNWGASFNLLKWASREPLYFEEGTVLYNYDNNQLGGTILRHFGHHRTLEWGGSFFVEQYKKSEKQILPIDMETPGPSELIQVKSLAKIEYSEYFVNYHSYILDGLTWAVNWQTVYNFSDGTLFNIAQLEAKQYIRIIKSGNLAMRTKIGIATNNNSPFAPFAIDSHLNLRGVGNRVDRGTAQGVLNIEYRQDLFRNHIPGSWGLQLVAFVDSGTWRSPGGTLKDIFNANQTRQFVGGGCRIIFTKIHNAILRIDYGVDLQNRNFTNPINNRQGWVIGFGQYF